MAKISAKLLTGAGDAAYAVDVTGVEPGTGSVIFTSEDGSHTATLNVTVTPLRLSSVTFSPTRLSLYSGRSGTITPRYTPGNATITSATFTVDAQYAGLISVVNNTDPETGALVSCTVTATASTGEAAVHFKAVSDGVDFDYDIPVTVTEVPVTATGVSFNPASIVISDANPAVNVELVYSPAGATPQAGSLTGGAGLVKIVRVPNSDGKVVGAILGADNEGSSGSTSVYFISSESSLTATLAVTVE